MSFFLRRFIMSEDNNNNKIDDRTDTTPTNTDSTPKKSASFRIVEILIVLVSCAILYGFYVRHSSPDYQGSLKFQNFLQFAIFFAVVFFIQLMFNKPKK